MGDAWRRIFAVRDPSIQLGPPPLPLVPPPLRRFLPTVLGVAALFFVDCGKSPPPESTESAKPEVALVMKLLANEFFKTMSDGAEAHLAAHAAEHELIFNGIKNETELAQPVNLVEQIVACGVDAIVIAPADSKALIPATIPRASSGSPCDHVATSMPSPKPTSPCPSSVPTAAPAPRLLAKCSPRRSRPVPPSRSSTACPRPTTPRWF